MLNKNHHLINISLGYIGYRVVSDIALNYIVNIDFFQNYQQIQNKIKMLLLIGEKITLKK